MPQIRYTLFVGYVVSIIANLWIKGDCTEAQPVLYFSTNSLSEKVHQKGKGRMRVSYRPCLEKGSGQLRMYRGIDRECI